MTCLSVWRLCLRFDTVHPVLLSAYIPSVGLVFHPVHGGIDVLRRPYGPWFFIPALEANLSLAVGAVFFRFRTSSSAGSPRGQSSQPWLREPASELLLSISRVVALSSKQPVGCRKDQTLYQAQNLKVRRHRSWSRLSSLTALDLAVDASGPTTGPSFSIF